MSILQRGLVRRTSSGAPERRPLDQAGFSLVEITVVVTLVLLLTSIAAPRIDLNRIRVDAAIQSAVSVVMSTRGQAILRQHDVILFVNEDAPGFRIVSDLNNNGQVDTGENDRVIELEDAVTFGRGGAPALFGYAATIAIQKRVEDTPALILRRNGSASEEAVIYFTSMRGNAGAAFPEDARALFIERATGRVACHSYRTLAWTEGC